VKRELSGLLEQGLSSGHLELIKRVADLASARRYPLYIVGGFVRDLLLGVPSQDFDLVLEGDAIVIAQGLVEKYGGTLSVHEKFRTAKIDIQGWELERKSPAGPKAGHPSLSSVDLISARSETYKHPAALPSVKMGTLADDLHRRDFTINALAIRLDGAFFGELNDELGGIDDLEHGRVRVLHAHSYLDDPTRMYRAVRYEKRYGFQITPQTLALIPEARSEIDQLSSQRVRRELELILAESKAASMLSRLVEVDLLKPIHAILSVDNDALQRLAQVQSSPPYAIPNLTPSNLRWLLWLMPLSEEQIESLNKRLHFTARLMESLVASSKLDPRLRLYADWKASECVVHLDHFPLLAVYAVFLAAPEGESKRALGKYLAEWRHVRPKTTGVQLKALGLQSGPRYQEILSRLRAAWLDGEVSSESQELSLLKELI
jgi:tRNA nucleotidyltransferase (CCA-adding enzyme)